MDLPQCVTERPTSNYDVSIDQVMNRCGLNVVDRKWADCAVLNLVSNAL